MTRTFQIQKKFQIRLIRIIIAIMQMIQQTKSPSSYAQGDTPGPIPGQIEKIPS